MPIRPFKKIKHSKLPETEAQKNYYMTMLLNEINLIKSNIAAYRANIGNYQNNVKVAEERIAKLETNFKETKAEYDKVHALDFSKEPEPEVVETIVNDTDETKIVEVVVDVPPEPTVDEPDELDQLLEEKGITKEKLLKLLKS